MNRFSFAFIFLLAFSSTCLARDIYVNGKTGDNRNAGYFAKDTGLMDGPVRTLAKALELARSGDRIILDAKSGPYRESVTLYGKNRGGSPDEPFIIEGCGAVLEGSEPIPAAIWRHYRKNIYRFQLTMQPVNMTYFHILDNGMPLEKIQVEPNAKEIPELKEDSWCLHRGFVYFRGSEGKTPILSSDYNLSYSDRTSGISLIQVLHVRIHDLTLQGYQLDGISAINGAQHIVLDNVACRSNGRSGLAIGGVSSVDAGYCVFEGNYGSEVLALPYSKGTLYQCDIPEGGLSQAAKNAEIRIENDDTP